MATPSGSTNPAKAAQNAATPQSLHYLGAFSSPAPRSVPSPATHRAQAGKSPFNASKHPASSSTIADSNHPTGGSGKLLGSSPAAAMLGTDSPAAMMFNLSSGGLDGGVAMGFSMSGLSGLGLGKTSTGGRPDDEERRRRLMEIIRLLGTCYPRISPEGIESLGKRYGMDVQMEPPNRVGIAEVAVAGFNGSFMVTVGFQYGKGTPNEQSLSNAKVTYDEFKHIQSATITFADKNAETRRQHDTSANRAIMRTLTLEPGQYYITSRLDKFAKNLERLGRMDKIYGTGFNAFEAVAGVYSALEKLYEHEKKIAMTVFGAAHGDVEERTEKEVLCKKSGRPVMNPRKTVGLCLDYWMKRRKLLNRQHETHKTPSTEAVKTGAMEIDPQDEADDRIADHFYTLVIECEENPSPEMYPPARVSNAWISEQIKQSEDPTDIFGPPIDWLDPPQTYLTEQNGTNTDNGIPLDNTHMGRLPNVRFVAKLDPPLVLPQTVANNILASVGSNLADPDIPRTYMGLLLDTDAEEDITAWLAAQPKHHRSERLVTVPGADETFTEHCHKNTLFVSKHEPGRVLEEIPFMHPKQLVQLLPILRQYALFDQVLADTFKNSKSASDQQASASGTTQTPIRMIDINLIPAMNPQFSMTSTVPQMNMAQINGTTNEPFTLEDLLQQANGDIDGDIEMPDRSASGDYISAIVEILPNADIHILDHTLVEATEVLTMLNSEGDGNPDGTQTREGQHRKVAERLGRALDISNHLGIWTEWMAKEAVRLSNSD